MGAISGGLVVIPADLRDETAAIASRRGVTARFKPLPVPEYLEADLGPANDVKTAVVTELFESGRLHVLIGHQVTAGGGVGFSQHQHAGCLASVVGSFMLTNQMRGRAIRTVAADPDKVANIWHLVAVEPPPQPGNAAMRMADAILDPPDYSTIRGEDYARLCRRFRLFHGPLIRRQRHRKRHPAHRHHPTAVRSGGHRADQRADAGTQRPARRSRRPMVRGG